MPKEIFSTGSYKFHPFADAWPMLPPDKLSEMAEDIKKDGQKLLIYLHPDDNSIIDGRNRYLACLEAGVKPKFCTWSGEGDLLDFLNSLNNVRRHLTAGQRAMAGAKLKEALAAEIAKTSKSKQVSDGIKRIDADKKSASAKLAVSKKGEGDSRTKAAKAANSSPAYVDRAEKIMKANPEVAKDVGEGRLTIPQGEAKAGIRKVPAYTPPVDTSRPPVAPPTNGAMTSRVNGVLTTDPPDVAKQRASGRLRPDQIVDIEDPDDSETVEDVIQEKQEERAIQEEGDSDEAWLAGLPLSSQLKGVPLKTFQEEALAWRRLSNASAKWKGAVARQLGSMRQKKGPYMYRVQLAIKLDPPQKWVRCAEYDQGGCTGTGQIPKVGQCKACFGSGYRVNN